jgi:hypothetical protein
MCNIGINQVLPLSKARISGYLFVQANSDSSCWRHWRHLRPMYEQTVQLQSASTYLGRMQLSYALQANCTHQRAVDWLPVAAHCNSFL